MENNLIPPFILQEDGLEVNNVPTIHCTRDEATPDDHTIQELESGLFIPLNLDSIFSVFHTLKPLEEDLEDGVVVIFTPEGITWVP